MFFQTSRLSLLSCSALIYVYLDAQNVLFRLLLQCNNNNNNKNFIYPGKDQAVDQDIDWLVLISDQYKKHQKVNKELTGIEFKLQF